MSITITKPINLSKPTIYCIPVDVLRIIGKKLGISSLTKLCITVPKLDKLFSNSNTQIYKTLIQYESVPWELLKNVCRLDSVELFLQVIWDSPKIALYRDSIASFCWQNHYFNVYDFLYNIYCHYKEANMHSIRCEDAIVKGDMKKLRYVVEFYTHETYGKRSWQILMNDALSRNTMQDPSVYLHLLNLGCTTYGLNWIFTNMCRDAVPLIYIEKLYNATHHIFDYNGIKPCLTYLSESIKSLEIVTFLNSIGLISYPITDDNIETFQIYPQDAKKFTERCTITPKILRVLLMHAINARNIENIKHLVALDWEPHQSIYDSFSNIVHKNCYTITEVLTPYFDKIIGCNQEKEIGEYMLKYLYAINYQPKSDIIAMQITTIANIYAKRINELAEYADKF